MDFKMVRKIPPDPPFKKGEIFNPLQNSINSKLKD